MPHPVSGPWRLPKALLVTATGLLCTTNLLVGAAPMPQETAAASHGDASHGAQLDCAPDGVGVGGYDLVSYQQPDGPVAGLPEHAVEQGGLRYLFANGKNRQAFLADPDRYLPVYSGYCAATLAMGRVACPDYLNFKIENGRLLLFEFAGFTNGRTLWNADPRGFRERADRNFQRLFRGSATRP